MYMHAYIGTISREIEKPLMLVLPLLLRADASGGRVGGRAQSSFGWLPLETLLKIWSTRANTYDTTDATRPGRVVGMVFITTVSLVVSLALPCSAASVALASVGRERLPWRVRGSSHWATATAESLRWGQPGARLRTSPS